MPDVISRTLKRYRPTEREIASAFDLSEMAPTTESIKVVGAMWTEIEGGLPSSVPITAVSSCIGSSVTEASTSAWGIMGGDVTITVTVTAPALTKTDLVDNEDENAMELIWRIRTNLLLSCREQLANRLEDLFSYAKEEDPDVVGIELGSLTSLSSFLLLYPKIMCPELSLTPDHYIYASWRFEDRLISLHFLKEWDVRFVIFKPNDMNPGKKIRIFGITTSDMLAETIASLGAFDWIRQ